MTGFMISYGWCVVAVDNGMPVEKVYGSKYQKQIYEIIKRQKKSHTLSVDTSQWNKVYKNNDIIESGKIHSRNTQTSRDCSCY